MAVTFAPTASHVTFRRSVAPRATTRREGELSNPHRPKEAPPSSSAIRKARERVDRTASIRKDKMDDSELEQIRKARLEQLKAQSSAAGRASGPSPGSQDQKQQDDARQHMLNQILHPEAADRLGRIRLVKEQRAVDVENRLITLAQTGQLRQKVTEAQLKELLSAVADTKEEEKIVVSRRKGWDDDDDDLLDL
ncbi:hypothetical protein E4U42_005915 [Claviceps africana]|uniref:DNA-binding TFAR19-related protein n=1 Tax=Claviceps africana TaxID=83212 RepID=A0A8K0J3A4_9HYPO|nr:hypothetical protein E4U42_005915 [Claviceps africana]